jgi:hypothetical protein
MKILFKKALVPNWTKVFIYSITIFCSLITFIEGVVIGLIFTFFLNAIPFFYFRFLEKIDRWAKDTMYKDPFFEKSNFTLVANGPKSFIAISLEKITIVNINSIIRIQNANHDITEIYKNYPKRGVEVEINGYNLYYFEIPVSEIIEINQINQGEAGWRYLGKGMQYGVRFKTKQNIIYDVDTLFPNEICAEINLHCKKL